MEVSERRLADMAGAELAAHVASYGCGVPAEEILRPKRGSARASFARQVAMYLCYVGFEISLTRVANAFDRDRSTVAHACHIIEDRREEPRFDRWISGLEAMMRRAPQPTARTL
ncbi:MAG TPA: helix-turn-helix domain-containing protein [Vitreimonas sp.]|uniref:helix-turn-helix domain-containing protein n=1 Tax=Vitreimonas sp. TaxID=3069702 RepID=UPI002D3D3D1D|nr:helix-turn-helix domain-containing protein [Vitreimonas sp.]HYD89170.1 helix-turn-helix domain-containing protein [Vitreimonas sp.]